MRSVVVALSAAILCACASGPQRPQVTGGQRVSLAGASFLAPAGKSWSVLVLSTYQVTLGALGDNSNETLVASMSTYQTRPFSNPQKWPRKSEQRFKWKLWA